MTTEKREIKKRHSWPRGLFEGIGQIIEKIPSDEEKRSIINSIEDLIKFLQDLQQRVAKMSSDIEREEVLKATRSLCSFLEKAYLDPTMLSILGLSLPKRRQKRETGVMEGDSLQTAIREIEATPIPELRTKLGGYSKSQLIAIGRGLSITVTERMSQVDIVNKIVKSLENMRGYDMLRELSSKESQS